MTDVCEKHGYPNRFCMGCVKDDRADLIKAITELRMREEGVSYYSMGWNRAVEKVLEILEGKNG